MYILYVALILNGQILAFEPKLTYTIQHKDLCKHAEVVMNEYANKKWNGRYKFFCIIKGKA